MLLPYLSFVLQNVTKTDIEKMPPPKFPCHSTGSARRHQHRQQQYHNVNRSTSNDGIAQQAPQYGANVLSYSNDPMNNPQLSTRFAGTGSNVASSGSNGGVAVTDGKYFILLKSFVFSFIIEPF